MSEFPREGRAASESKAAELVNREGTFRLLVESIKDYAVFMLSPEGVVTTWNKGAESIKGYRSDRDHRPAFLTILYRGRRRQREAATRTPHRRRRRQV